MEKVKQQTKTTSMTGDDVGRLLIADLVTLYKNALQGTENSVLSISETTRLVNSLENTKDIRTYNEYKYLHDFVVTVPIRYLLAQNQAEVVFERLSNALERVRDAETAIQVHRQAPIIVTQSEYFQNLRERDQKVFAILQENHLTQGMVDENGLYSPPKAYPFMNDFRAEKLLAEATHILGWIQDLKLHYQEMYAYHAFLSIAEEFTQVKDLQILLSPVDDSLIHKINCLFLLWQEIGLADGRDEEKRNHLTQSLQKMLVPIQPSSLRPTKNAIKAAKNNMSFTIFHGYATEFINRYLVQPENAK